MRVVVDIEARCVPDRAKFSEQVEQLLWSYVVAVVALVIVVVVIVEVDVDVGSTIIV